MLKVIFVIPRCNTYTLMYIGSPGAKRTAYHIIYFHILLYVINIRDTDFVNVEDSCRHKNI